MSDALVKPRILVRPGIGWLPLLLVLVVLAGAAGAAYWFLLRAPNIPTITVSRGTVVKAFYATGVVRPDFEYTIKSRTQGALLGLEKREGAHVTKGEVLARIDDRQLQFEVEKCRAELEEARKQARDDAPQRAEIAARLAEASEQLAIADSNLKRVITSSGQGASSATDVDNARKSHVQWANTTAALESQIGTWKIESQRRVDVASANLRKAQANLADCDVSSPIDGLILERFVEGQQIVGINEKLFLIAAPDDLLMKAAVDEEDITRTLPGQKVLMQLYAFQDRDEVTPSAGSHLKILEGRVTEILPSANPANKTYEVKVKFVERPDRLKVGMTGELNFIESESQRNGVLVVPSSAVLDNKVYRPTAGRRFEPVSVTVGLRTLEKAEITAGLSEGDIIVADAKQVAPVKLPPQKPPVVPTRNGDNVAEQ